MKEECKYIEIYELLRRGIRDGRYPYGTKIPSKRAIASEQNVSVITAEHALELLLEEGYIESRERSGNFVRYHADLFFAVPEKQEENSTAGKEHFSEIRSSIRYEENRFPYSIYVRTARQVLSTFGDKLMERSEKNGVACLREAIAAYLMRSRGMRVDADQILIGSGAEYLYGQIIKALGRELKYGIEDPSYQNIAGVYGAENVRVRRLRIEKDGIDTQVLWNSDADVLHVSPYRSFPTGATASASKKREYLQWSRTRGTIIIEDDFESEFSPRRKPEETLFSLADGETVIYLNTFTRTVGPFIRIAYLVIPKNLLPRFRERIGFYACPVPTPEQYVLAELIRSGQFERHLNRVRRKNRALRDKQDCF